MKHTKGGPTTGAFRKYGVITLPEGLRVAPIPGQVGKYWLDEFPADLFPANSMIRHDAVHYGVWLTEEEVA